MFIALRYLLQLILIKSTYLIGGNANMTPIHSQFMRSADDVHLQPTTSTAEITRNLPAAIASHPQTPQRERSSRLPPYPSQWMPQVGRLRQDRYRRLCNDGNDERSATGGREEPINTAQHASESQGKEPDTTRPMGAQTMEKRLLDVPSGRTAHKLLSKSDDRLWQSNKQQSVPNYFVHDVKQVRQCASNDDANHEKMHFHRAATAQTTSPKLKQPADGIVRSLPPSSSSTITKENNRHGGANIVGTGAEFDECDERTNNGVKMIEENDKEKQQLEQRLLQIITSNGDEACC